MSLQYIPSYSEIRTYIKVELRDSDEVELDKGIILNHQDASMIAHDLRLSCKYISIKNVYVFRVEPFSQENEIVIHNWNFSR